MFFFFFNVSQNPGPDEMSCNGYGKWYIFRKILFLKGEKRLFCFLFFRAFAVYRTSSDKDRMQSNAQHELKSLGEGIYL